jgi:hypothetical protein
VAAASFIEKPTQARLLAPVAHPNPPDMSRVPDTRSVAPAVPPHQNITNLGWNPSPVTATVVPRAPVPVRKEPTRVVT